MPGPDRVLIVDDERDIANYLAKAARNCGYVASVATRFDEVCTKLASLDPTVVVLDQSMPGKDGIRYLKALSDEGCTAKVIVIGALDNRAFLTASHLGEILGLNIVESLSRPFSMHSFRRILQRLSGIDETITATELESAIRGGQVMPRYQPRVAVRSGRGFDVSAIGIRVCWHREDASVLPQSDFNGMVQSFNLAHLLVDNLVEQVAVQLSAWSAQGHSFDASIGVPSSLLLDTDLPDRLQGICRKAGINNSRLTLEVTEDQVLDHSAEMLETLGRLHVRGFRLAISNFGSSYSSLSQLYRMPFDELMIDSSIVSACEASHEARAIVETAIFLGHKFGLDVGAMGVENQKTFERLKKLRCDYLQGYFIGRMVPAEGFLSCANAWYERVQTNGSTADCPPHQPQA